MTSCDGTKLVVLAKELDRLSAMRLAFVGVDGDDVELLLQLVCLILGREGASGSRGRRRSGSDLEVDLANVAPQLDRFVLLGGRELRDVGATLERGVTEAITGVRLRVRVSLRVRGRGRS